VSILADLAKIPTRIYEYAALLAFVAGAGVWFVHYEQAVGKQELLEELDRRAASTQKQLDKDAVQVKQQADPKFHVLDEAIKRYALPVPHPADDCIDTADGVRAVNAAHQARRS
jgi:hypothetical protein